MLKSVIQQMDALAANFAFRQQARLIAAGADVNRHSCRTRDQQGFIPKSLCAPGRIDALYRLLRSSVAAGQDIGTAALPLQQPRQADHQRRLARTAHGEVADADHRPAQPLRQACGQSAHFWPGPRIHTPTTAEPAKAGSCGGGNKPSRAVIGAAGSARLMMEYFERAHPKRICRLVIGEQILEHRHQGFRGGQFQRFSLEQRVDDGAEVRIMVAHHHGYGELRRLQRIMAARRDQAPTHKGNRGQCIH